MADDKSRMDTDKIQFIRWLEGFLGPNQQKLDGVNAYDAAVGLAQQQPTRWERLFNIFEGPLLRQNTTAHNRLSVLRAVLASAPPARPVRDGDQVTVNSTLPILIRDASDSEITEGQQFPFVAAVIIARRCEQYLLSSTNSDVLNFVQIVGAAETINLSRRAAGARPADLQQIDMESNVRTALSDLTSALSELKDFKTNLQGQLENFEVKLHDEVTDLAQRELAELENDQRQAETDRLEGWDVEKARALQSLRDEVSEFVKIESSIDLWRTKANWHTGSYVVLSVIFALSLLTIAVSLLLGINYGYGSAYINELAKLSGNQQFLAIALLAIPTLAIAWLLRLIARLTVQNVSLAHDARQRHAIIRTYLRLLGDPKKPINEKERILALAALFRPLPGQGLDDVNPPTIADLLKEAQEQLPKAR